MSLSPWIAGATLPLLAVTVTQDNGQAMNLATATLSLLIRNRSGGEITGVGSWTITNAAQGQASYAWVAADVATPGVYDLIVVVTIGGGVVKCDPIPFQINPS